MVKKERKQRNELNSILDICIRYIIALILGLNLSIFYFIFAPITFYPVIYILSLFFNISMSFPYIFINNFSIEIIGACIAASAYYFFTCLILLTRDLSIKKRLVLFLFTFSVFLIANIIRIVIMASLFVNSFEFFDITHLIVWYLISAIFVFGVWVLALKIFNIKSIPFYSDFIYIKSKIKK
ncbi:pacearchaeosortase [Candidatus Pacearchaeota archaeon]|nr:pacearchaeosortase [Candidatus Pacearchaeota archaeon]